MGKIANIKLMYYFAGEVYELKPVTKILFFSAVLLATLLVSLVLSENRPRIHNYGGFRAPVTDNSGGDRQPAIFSVEGEFPSDRIIVSEETHESLKFAKNERSVAHGRISRNIAAIISAAQRHIWKAYTSEYARSVTEGGKDKIDTASAMKDWSKAIAPICPA